MMNQPVFMKCAAVLPLLALVVTWSGCSPVDPDFNSPAGLGERPEPGETSTKSTVAAPDTGALPGVGSLDGTGDSPPDWQERRQVLRRELAERFNPPAPGDDILVTLKSGSDKSGLVVEITAEHLVLSMVDATVTYPKEALAPESRLRFIKEDYLNYHANRKVREEQRVYEARQALRQMDRALNRGIVAPSASKLGLR